MNSVRCCLYYSCPAEWIGLSFTMTNSIEAMANRFSGHFAREAVRLAVILGTKGQSVRSHGRGLRSLNSWPQLLLMFYGRMTYGKDPQCCDIIRNVGEKNVHRTPYTKCRFRRFRSLFWSPGRSYSRLEGIVRRSAVDKTWIVSDVPRMLSSMFISYDEIIGANTALAKPISRRPSETRGKTQNIEIAP